MRIEQMSVRNDIKNTVSKRRQVCLARHRLLSQSCVSATDCILLGMWRSPAMPICCTSQLTHTISWNGSSVRIVRLRHSIRKATDAQDTKGMTTQEAHKGPRPDTNGGTFWTGVPQSMLFTPGKIRAEPARLKTTTERVQLLPMTDIKGASC